VRDSFSHTPSRGRIQGVTLETTGDQTVYGIDDETKRVSGVLWERLYRFMHTCMHTLSVRGPSLPDLWGPNIHRYLSRGPRISPETFSPSFSSIRALLSFLFSFSRSIYRFACDVGLRKLAKPRKVSAGRISGNVICFSRKEGKHVEELN